MQKETKFECESVTKGSEQVVVCKRKEKLFTATKIAKASIFAGIAALLYSYLKFKLPPFPDFLELNLSDVPTLIGSFMLGPVYAFIIVTVKVLLKFILMPTTTAGVGELADFIIGIAYMVPAAYIYKKNKSIKGALIAIIVGGLLSILVAMVANRYIIVPYYAKNVVPFSFIVKATKSLIPSITEQNFYPYYIFFAVLPFNVIRCAVSGVLTFLLYKRISKILSKF